MSLPADGCELALVGLVGRCESLGIELSVHAGRVVVEADDEIPSDLLAGLREHRDELLEFLLAPVSAPTVAELLAELSRYGCGVIPDVERPGKTMLSGDWSSLPNELVDRVDASWAGIVAYVANESQPSAMSDRPEAEGPKAMERPELVWPEFAWKQKIHGKHDPWPVPKVDPRVIAASRPKCPWSRRQAGLE